MFHLFLLHAPHLNKWVIDRLLQNLKINSIPESIKLLHQNRGGTDVTTRGSICTIEQMFKTECLFDTNCSSRAINLFSPRAEFQFEHAMCLKKAHLMMAAFKCLLYMFLLHFSYLRLCRHSLSLVLFIPHKFLFHSCFQSFRELQLEAPTVYCTGAFLFSQYE